MQFNKYNQNFKVSANVKGSISIEQHPSAVSIVSAQRPLIFCCNKCYLSGGALDITSELNLTRSLDTALQGLLNRELYWRCSPDIDGNQNGSTKPL